MDSLQGSSANEQELISLYTETNEVCKLLHCLCKPEEVMLNSLVTYSNYLTVTREKAAWEKAETREYKVNVLGLVCYLKEDSLDVKAIDWGPVDAKRDLSNGSKI